jgi:hypothetical protein
MPKAHLDRVIVLAFIAWFAVSAAAQAPAPTRIRGVIEKVDGQTLTIKPRGDAPSVTVRLADNFTVSGLTRASLADIVPGKYVGIASLPAPGGSLRALEILVFPDTARGTNEGHGAWDLQPQSLMTNATVAEVASPPEGRTLTLRYKDGEQKIVVPEGIPIVTGAPADRSALVPGAGVFIFAAQRQSDGTFTAPRVTVGLNGLVPPM